MYKKHCFGELFKIRSVIFTQVYSALWLFHCNYKRKSLGLWNKTAWQVNRGWGFQFSGMWRSFTGRVVTDVSKDRSVFILRVMQFEKNFLGFPRTAISHNVGNNSSRLRDMESSPAPLWEPQASFSQVQKTYLPLSWQARNMQPFAQHTRSSKPGVNTYLCLALSPFPLCSIRCVLHFEQ